MPFDDVLMGMLLQSQETTIPQVKHRTAHHQGKRGLQSGAEEFDSGKGEELSYIKQSAWLGCLSISVVKSCGPTL